MTKKILIGRVVPHRFPGSGTTHALVRMSEGASIGGSSGAGLWRRDDAGRDLLVGTISGSSAGTCPPREVVTYGRLSRFHPRIADWIGAGSAPEDVYVGDHAGFLLREPLGAVLAELDDGYVIDPSAVGTGSYNIQAGFSLAAAPPSVAFELTGPRSVSRTSNTAPHRLVAAGGGMGFAPGDYALTAVAYAGPDASGDVLETRSIAFTVTGTADEGDLRVASLWLADSNDGTVFGEITDGGTVTVNRDLDATLEIRAATAGTGQVASVGYVLSGPVSSTGTVDGAAYAWEAALPPGTYTVTATPYPAAGGAGAAGTPLTRTAFTIAYPSARVPVQRLVLVDASDGTEAMDLVPDAVVDLDATSARSFNIRAEIADGAMVASVRMDLEGPVAASRVSNAAPHALHGASGGGPLVAGDYTITAAPFARAGATGAALPARAVSFKVVGGAGETDIAVTRLTLVDADGGELAALADGTVVRLPVPSGTRLGIRADTGGATVGSVGFGLSGAAQVAHTANDMPFTWHGTLTPGTYAIAATPYPEADLAGQAGTALTVANVVVAYAYATALEAVTLVDAGVPVEADVAGLVDGATVDLATTSKRLKLRVDLVPDRAGSVRVVFAGPVSGDFLHDGGGTFSLLGETAPGDAGGRSLPNGEYTLTLTLYEGSGGTGHHWTETLRFTVRGSYDAADSPLAGFTVVDAEGPPPDDDVTGVAEGAAVDLSTTSARSITLRAEPASDPRRLAGVAFELAGPVAASTRDDGAAPYSLHGEAGPGDYLGGLLPDGDYTLTATPYSAEPAFGPVTGDGNVRLVDGGNPAAGRVEVRHGGAWGTVCDAGWDLDDADVVCAQLGLGEAIRAPGGAAYGQGTGPVALGRLQCTGDESGLLACPSGGTGGCGHGRDAGAVCAGTPLTVLTRTFSVVNGTPSNPVAGFTALRTGQAPTVLGTVADGATLDLSATGLVPLTFRADIPADAEGVGSVLLTLAGLASASRMDSDSDYTLHPFNAGSGLYPDGVWLANGEYTMEATAFSGANGTGTSFGTVTATFTVVGSDDPPTAVTGFEVVDPRDPDTVLATITDGATLDLDALLGTAAGIDIRPVLDAQGVEPGSVRLDLEGATVAARLAEDAPFHLFGGDAGARLATGAHTLTATAYSQSGGQGLPGPSGTAGFTVTTRPLSWDEFALGQPVPGTFYPSGLYSDGATTWVSDLNSGRLIAYRSWEASRVPSRDIRSAATQPAGLWSDGTTLLVADYAGGRVVAHQLADGAPLPSQDFRLVAGNAAPSGVWSDGDVVLVADYGAGKVFGYGLAGPRRPDLDIDVSADVDSAWGLWSDGRTLWVADWRGGAVRAYARADGSRQPEADIDTAAAGNPNPMGVYADGTRLWTTDTTHRTVHAYRLPQQLPGSIAAAPWTTTLTVGDRGGRGFSSMSARDIGSLADDTFEYAGAARQIQVVGADREAVMFKTRGGGDTLGGLVLEWGGAVLPLDDAVHGRYSAFTWDQAWLDVNAPSLNAANYETTLPIGGSETVCLRVDSVACPPKPTFADGASADGASASRTVAENAAAGTAAGAAVVATGGTGNGLAYSLAGPDAAEFAIDASTGQLTTATVLDHEAGASRSVTVSTADGDGGATSIPVTVLVTNVDEPPDAPAAPTVSAASSTSLSVSWSAPANAGRPAVTDYDVRYASGGGAFSDWTHDGATTAATITGLTADTAYQVQVLARNAEGASVWSASGDGRTNAAEAALAAWFDSLPDAHDGSSVFTLELAFSEPVFDGTESFDKNQAIQDALQVTGGTVRGRRRVEREVYDRWLLRIRPSGRDDVTVSLPATTSGCDVAGAICTPDGRPLSAPASATIPGPPPEAPDAPATPTLTAGTTWLEASWTPPSENGAAITDYDVEYRQTGGDWTDASHAGPATVKRIEGLAAESDYEVRVRASNAEGAGDWSPAASGRTGASDGDVRLVGGSTPQEGRVEIHHDGAWGTVCDDRFTSEDAAVVCRQLGYAGGDAHRRAAFGEGAGTIAMDDVQCTGSESRLANCPFTGWGLHNCRHAEDVGVSCGAAAGNPLANATVSGALLTLRFDRALDGGSVPSADDFVVTSGTPEAAVPVEAVAVVDGEAVLTLSRPVGPSEHARVSYLPAAMHPLQDGSYNPVPPLSGRLVRHAPDAAPPAHLPETGSRRAAKLEVLDFSASGLSDLSALAGLTDVEVLDLGGNRVDDLWPLTGMAGLEVLDLGDNAVDDLSALASLRHLRVLDLSSNAVSDVTPLAGLTRLQRLDLSGNRVADLRPLSELRGLEVLLLDGNRVADLVPLWGLRDLAHLGLRNNRIADVSLLRELRSLRRLDLSGNGLRDVSALGDLPDLVWLRVSGNPITDLPRVGRLTALRWLMLDGERAPLWLIEATDTMPSGRP